MSFGRPPSINSGFKVTAPDRGSFPLDHYAECKDQMTIYMNCLRNNSSTSSSCRELSKKYLDCRMDKGLMERDEWKNLGMANVDSNTENEKTANTSTNSAAHTASTSSKT